MAEIRPENKEATTLIDEYYKGGPVEIYEPEPLQLGPVFTEQQIQDYIDKIEKADWRPPQANRDMLFQALQIIKKLQEPKEVDMELLAAAVHDAYCRCYVKTHSEQYWTNGDYKLLDEETKEIDRETVRAVLRQQAYSYRVSHPNRDNSATGKQ